LPFLAVPVADGCQSHASRLLREAFRRYAKSSDTMRRTFSFTAWQECGRLLLVCASHADHNRDWRELRRTWYLTACAQCFLRTQSQSAELPVDRCHTTQQQLSPLPRRLDVLIREQLSQAKLNASGRLTSCEKKGKVWPCCKCMCLRIWMPCTGIPASKSCS
jgi:hypothetical protein